MNRTPLYFAVAAALFPTQAYAQTLSCDLKNTPIPAPPGYSEVTTRRLDWDLVTSPTGESKDTILISGYIFANKGNGVNFNELYIPVDGYKAPNVYQRVFTFRRDVLFDWSSTGAIAATNSWAQYINICGDGSYTSGQEPPVVLFTSNKFDSGVISSVSNTADFRSDFIHIKDAELQLGERIGNIRFGGNKNGFDQPTGIYLYNGVFNSSFPKMQIAPSAGFTWGFYGGDNKVIYSNYHDIVGTAYNVELTNQANATFVAPNILARNGYLEISNGGTLTIDQGKLRLIGSRVSKIASSINSAATVRLLGSGSELFLAGVDIDGVNEEVLFDLKNNTKFHVYDVTSLATFGGGEINATGDVRFKLSPGSELATYNIVADPNPNAFPGRFIPTQGNFYFEGDDAYTYIGGLEATNQARIDWRIDNQHGAQGSRNITLGNSAFILPDTGHYSYFLGFFTNSILMGSGAFGTRGGNTFFENTRIQICEDVCLSDSELSGYVLDRGITDPNFKADKTLKTLTFNSNVGFTNTKLYASVDPAGQEISPGLTAAGFKKYSDALQINGRVVSMSELEIIVSNATGIYADADDLVNGGWPGSYVYTVVSASDSIDGTPTVSTGSTMPYNVEAYVWNDPVADKSVAVRFRKLSAPQINNKPQLNSPNSGSLANAINNNSNALNGASPAAAAVAANNAISVSLNLAANNAVNAAKAQTDAQNQVTNAQQAANAAQQAAKQADTAAAALKASQTTANINNAVSTANSASTSAASALSSATAAATAAQQAVDQNQKSVNQAMQTVQTATDNDNKLGTTATAQSLQAAQSTLASAQAALTTSQHTLTQANNLVTTANTAQQHAQQALQSANAVAANPTGMQAMAHVTSTSQSAMSSMAHTNQAQQTTQTANNAAATGATHQNNSNNNAQNTAATNNLSSKNSTTTANPQGNLASHNSTNHQNAVNAVNNAQNTLATNGGNAQKAHQSATTAANAQQAAVNAATASNNAQTAAQTATTAAATAQTAANTHAGTGTQQSANTAATAAQASSAAATAAQTAAQTAHQQAQTANQQAQAHAQQTASQLTTAQQTHQQQNNATSAAALNAAQQNHQAAQNLQSQTQNLVNQTQTALTQANTAAQTANQSQSAAQTAAQSPTNNTAANASATAASAHTTQANTASNASQAAGTAANSTQTTATNTQTTATQTAATVTQTNNTANNQTVTTVQQQHATANQTHVSGAANSLTNAQLAGLNNVHGEAYSSYLTVGLEHISGTASTLIDHASCHTRNLDSDSCQDWWIDFRSIDGSVEGANRLGNFNYQLQDLTIGKDLVSNEQLTAGIAFIAGSQDMREHDIIDQNFDSSHYGLGGYASFSGGNWFINGSTAVVWAEHETERFNQDVGPFTGGLASAEFDSTAYIGNLEFGTTLALSDSFSIRPLVGYQYGVLDQDRFTETGGGDFNFTVHNTKAKTSIGYVGADLLGSINIGSTTVYPQLSYRYQHDGKASDDNAHEAILSTQAFGEFTQYGQNKGSTTHLGKLGVVFKIGGAGSISADYIYGDSDYGDEQGGQISWRFSF